MIKNLLSEEPEGLEDSKPSRTPSSDTVIHLFDAPESTGTGSTAGGDSVAPQPEFESMADTARRTGLAWSAGIAFFAAVVFMLVLGWGADVLLGTSPWGIVGGIILGSLIGFIQFFRITSQIFKK